MVFVFIEVRMKSIRSAVNGISRLGVTIAVMSGVWTVAAADPATNATTPPVPVVVVPSSPTGAPTVSNSPNYSFAVTEVLKMKDANVSPEVIKDFIQVSASPFQPTASDIIALKQRGVSEDLIQGMLRRDGQLQASVAPPQSQQPYPVQGIPMTQPAPAYGSAVQPSTVYYSEPVADYSYYNYYPSYYPSYAYAGWGLGLGWGWGWPGYSGYWNHRGAYYGGYRGPINHPFPGHPGGFGGHPGGWNGGHAPAGGTHFVGGHTGGAGGHVGGGGHRGR